MKNLTVIFFSSWKFAATFPFAVLVLKMSFLETIIYTNIGAILGILVFALASKGIIKLVDYIKTKMDREGKKKPKKIFTKRNRRIIVIKRKYGLPGIVILTPVLLSIPIGTFLVTKYYGDNKKSYVYLMFGHVVWSVVYTFIYMQMYAVV